MVANVQARIRAELSSLAPAERRVAEAILADPGYVVERTISELAVLCRTSETTVVRFCRSIGFKGYPELRLAVAGELGRSGGPTQDDLELAADITRDDPLSQMVRKLGYAERRAIDDTVEQLDLAALERVIGAVSGARRIHLFGLGASALAAHDLQEKLLRINLMAYTVADPHLALAAAALLGEGDVGLAVSHSGDTPEAEEFLRHAARGGATTVVVTNHPRSPAAQAAGLVLTTSVRETAFRSGAMASRIAQLAIVDCVFLGVVQRSYPAATAALAATYDAVRPRRRH